MISRYFGTSRGLVRLALAHVEVGSGQGAIRAPAAESVRRLVFVCQGNICRSAFAEIVARRQDLDAASFGLSTQSGKLAYAPAVEAAAGLGYTLDTHLTTRVQDYTPCPGDLLLAMEIRQLRMLARDARLTHAPRTLLGLYTRPKYPHLHDPYLLSDAYMRTCLKRIETSIPRLKAMFSNAVTDD